MVVAVAGRTEGGLDGGAWLATRSPPHRGRSAAYLDVDR